ncbi:MAG: M20/M25/M40 family metallo-hydrolase, partial [Myxococcaceae bacterium]
MTPSRTRAARRGLIAAALLVCFALAAAGHIAQPFTGKREATAPFPVSPEKLRADVTKLTTEFIPRDSEHPEVLDRAAAWLRTELEPTGATLSEQVFQLDGKDFRNVVADFGPLTDEKIIVTAHYDAAKGFPGADDDASGTAVLLELARQLKDVKLKTRVELVAVSLEEVSHLKTALNGSGALAKGMKDRGEKVRAMISLEMLGCFTDAPGSQRFPAAVLKLLYPDEGNYAVVVGNLTSPALVRRVKGGFAGATRLPVKSIN